VTDIGRRMLRGHHAQQKASDVLGACRSRTERQSRRPKVVQYELSLSLGIVKDNGWGHA